MKVKISDLGKISTGNTPNKNESIYWDSNDVPFVKPDDLQDMMITDTIEAHEYISNCGKEKARIVNKDSILVTCIGSIGKVGIANTEVAFNQQINAIMPYKEFSSKYIAYAIYANKRKLQTIANAPVVPIINKTQFCNFELNVNIIKEEQMQISKKLDCLSDLIIKYKEEMQKMDLLVKARFIEMLLTGNYDEIPIKDLVDLNIVSAKKTFSSNDLIHYIDISSIDNESNVITSYKHYAMKDAPSRAQQLIVYDDILISTVRPNLRNTAQNKDKDSNLVASSGFCILRASKCNAQFLLYSVLTDDFTNAMVSKTTGASYPAIKDDDILKYKIALPPIELQNEFADFVKLIDKSKLAVQKSLEKTQQLFDSLMQEYFG